MWRWPGEPETGRLRSALGGCMAILTLPVGSSELGFKNLKI